MFSGRFFESIRAAINTQWVEIFSEGEFLFLSHIFFLLAKIKTRQCRAWVFMLSISKNFRELKKNLNQSWESFSITKSVDLGWIGKQVENGPINLYLDPASNSGSKPRLLSDKNCKSCNWKQNKYFWHFL